MHPTPIHRTRVVRAADAGLDPSFPWYASCERHATLIGARTRADARRSAAVPTDWCDACRDERARQDARAARSRYVRNLDADGPTARELYGSPLLRMLWDAADASPAAVSDALLPAWGDVRAIEREHGTGAAVFDVLQRVARIGDARAVRYVRRVARIVRRIVADASAAAWAADAARELQRRPAPVPGLIPLR